MGTKKINYQLADLVRWIEEGTTRVTVLRQYVNRVAQRSRPDECKHGHFGCAMVPRGPCENECLALMESLIEPATRDGNTTKRARAAREAGRSDDADTLRGARSEWVALHEQALDWQTRRVDKDYRQRRVDEALWWVGRIDKRIAALKLSDGHA